jgi:hypothetical protein
MNKIKIKIVLFLIFIILLVLLFYKFYIKQLEDFISESKYTAVIVEPREHPALLFVLNNILENLSDEWNVLIFHGNKNIEYLNNIIDTKLHNYKDKINLINLNVDNLTISEYNNLLTSESFYTQIPTETFLIFQTDSMISEKNKDNINKFLEFDYVGAPWSDSEQNSNVGNGGFSLRKKSKMIEKIIKCPYDNVHEDLFFSDDNCLKLYKPDKELAKQFSVEHVFYDNPFAVHKAYEHIKGQELNILTENVNGLDELMKLNN